MVAINCACRGNNDENATMRIGENAGRAYRVPLSIRARYFIRSFRDSRLGPRGPLLHHLPWRRASAFVMGIACPPRNHLAISKLRANMHDENNICGNDRHSGFRVRVGIIYTCWDYTYVFPVIP